MATAGTDRPHWGSAGGFSARLAQFIETVPEGTLVVDETGRIRLANTEVAEIFGYAPDELIGLSVEDLMPEDERARHRGARADFARSPRVNTTALE